MENGKTGSLALLDGVRRTVGVRAQEVVLAMGRGGERTRMREALASGGWSVTAVDDGWGLLEHLAAALAPGSAWKAPRLVLLEIAVAGPRLAEVFGRLRDLVPDLRVLLVGVPRAGITERSAGLILRGPVVPERVLAAAAHAVCDPSALRSGTRAR